MIEKKIQKYDFKRPDRVSKNQIRSLHFVHDRFARNFSSSLSAYLRTVVEISLDDIAQISYSEFMNTVSDPTCYAAISLKPLDGLAALEIGPALVFPIIDRLLGGIGQPITTVRPMTEIEQSIIQNVLKLLVDNLKESWRQVYTIDFSVTATETHPHMVQITSPNEMVIHFGFQVRMRDTLTKMHLAIPTLVLEPIMHIFDQEEYSRRKIVHDDGLLHLLRQVPVKVSIETAETSFPLQSLVSLQAGDTIVLDQRKEWPVSIKVAGKSKMQAKAQMDSTRKSFGITGLIRPRRQEPVNGQLSLTK
ncbi:MAG TPA: flagellar motor switch protein FliM [Terriglobia bacterium]|jgi:flagellar motor switch protein FliM